MNITLAQLLQARGAVVAPESIMYTGTERDRQMPDVIVDYQGLRTAIEGEYAAPKAKEKAIASATHRVETGIAHIGIGVVYPVRLRGVNYSTLNHELAHAKLEIAIATETGSTGFESGDVDYLERALRSTFEQLVKEDVVAEAVALLDVAIDRFAGVVLPHRGIWGRITQELGGSVSAKELDQLSHVQRAANCRIGGLVLMNAMIFHDILSRDNTRVTSISKIIADKTLDKFPEEWLYILETINYYSIFHLARQIFLSVSSSALGAPETLMSMAETAKKISERRAALRHDLMGRVYHRLLTEAKYLGTYYTSIPAATLLLKLALRPEDWSIQWDDLGQIGKLRIADLACGTGTLLMAVADTISDNYISQSAAAGKPVQLSALHKAITEEIIHGYDVLPAAIHLTASTLALRNPDVPVEHMYLYALPLGGKENKLGSLEFLSGNLAQTSLDLSGNLNETAIAQQVTGKALKRKYISLPDELDLCVMNPPFVRSVGGNLLFGSIPEKNRTQMQTRLKKMVKSLDASITSGLGSVFVALGNKRIKRMGRLALVLPKALLSGVSWAETRTLINRQYALDYVVVSHDAQRWNFSDSTDLSEVLLVATKYDGLTPPIDHKVRVVNLWRNPTTALEALAMASQIRNASPPDLVTGQGAAAITLNAEKAGEIITYSWQEMKSDWFLPCTFAQIDLTRSAYHLLRGKFKLPYSDNELDINLCKLGDLGVLGPDRRDIHDGFNLSTAKTEFPSYWGHDAAKTLTIAQSPNKYLEPLSRAKKGRSLRKSSTLWKLAGTLLLAERMWLKTQRLVAIRMDEPVLANVWWSFAFQENVTGKNSDKALALWLNSTLAIYILLATRDETRGAWVDFKKPSLTAMPVLDVRKLLTDQLNVLAEAYDKICDQTLKPLPQMAVDDVRLQIDTAIAQTLGLPDFSILRRMLAREPVVCMERI